jgi:hypothetical protein
MSNTQWKRLLTQPVAGDHIVQMYQDEEFLIEAVSRFVCAGLQQREGIVVIAGKAHWGVIEGRLERDGFNVQDAIKRGQLKSLDADETLAGFMQDDMPDRHAFLQQMSAVMDDLHRHYPTVRAYGEMVDILWQDGRYEAAESLEDHWNHLAGLKSFSLLCAYCIDHRTAATHAPLQRVCKAHSHVISPKICAVTREVTATTVGPSRPLAGVGHSTKITSHDQAIFS